MPGCCIGSASRNGDRSTLISMTVKTTLITTAAAVVVVVVVESG